MSWIPHGFDQSAHSLAQAQISVLIFGFLAAMLSMLVGVEMRVAQTKRPSNKSWFWRRFPLSACYLVSMWFTSVFTSLALPLAKISSFSITASVITFIIWISVIMSQDYVAQNLKHKAGLFQFLYSVFATFSFFGAHSCFLFLPSSLKIKAVYWPGLVVSFLAVYFFIGLLSKFAQQTSVGKNRVVRDRLIYVTSLVLINQLIVFALIAFVELNTYSKTFSAFWLAMDWGSFEVFVSVLGLAMIMLLIYRVYLSLDASMTALRTDSENLKKMNRIALQEVASASDSLRVKQDKIAQLEKVIVSAKTEHLLSVEGLLAALSTLEEGMFEWDLEEDSIEMSKQWVVLFGLLNSGSTRQKVSEWKSGFIPDDLLLLEEATERLLMADDQALSVQARYRTPAGSLLKLEIRMASVQNPYGMSGRVVGVFHDRTEEMDLELSIRQELSEESILSTRKTQFVSYLAHEIRTPMTIITSAKALLESTLKRDPEVSDRVFQYIDQIGTALGSLRGLVDETLMFMGTTYPKSQLLIEKLDLKGLLNRFAEVEQKRRFLGRPIQITCVSELSDSAFYSDETIISQAIRHLANFAMEHVSEHPVIEVSLEDEMLGLSYHMSAWPLWMVRAGELEPATDQEVMVPFSDEYLPFSLLITKRVIRLVNGRIMIKSMKGKHRLIAEMPSLREGSWLES